jgi:hypothetical protein
MKTDTEVRCMRIETQDYRIARLMDDPQAVQAIQQAEAKIAELSGHDVTLIAYSKTAEEGK